MPPFQGNMQKHIYLYIQIYIQNKISGPVL